MMKDFVSNFWYSLWKNSFYIVFKIIWRLEVRGRHHIPPHGPFIIASNHRSYADPPLVGCVISGPSHFLARRSLFKGPFGYLIKTLNAHPISRSGGAEAFKIAEDLLKEGKKVILFPEGTRMKDDNLGPAKPGIGRIAKAAGVPIIPVYVHNSGHMKELSKVILQFGKSMDPQKYKNYQSLADAVLSEIGQLKEKVISKTD